MVAAKTARERGLSVILLQPGKFIGGMTSGGLGWTDFGKKHVIGGASRQFYRDVGAVYGLEEEEWLFEPHAAAAVFDRYLRETGVDLRLCQYLDSVKVENLRIREIRLLGGLTVKADYFMDTTYEGDLLAKAGVSHHIGREANSVYGETINGTQIRQTHQFTAPVDPYRAEGDPRSGTLPGVRQEDAAVPGSGDSLIQAYNFRICMTDDPEIRIPWEKPEEMDSHNCQRIIHEGRVLNEGDVQLKPAGPYPVSYRSIVPRRGECENLAVPVCISSSHIAFGSVRMEPVFMVLAESAALAVSIAFKQKTALQDVPYPELLPLLREAKQVLTREDAMA